MAKKDLCDFTQELKADPYMIPYSDTKLCKFYLEELEEQVRDFFVLKSSFESLIWLQSKPETKMCYSLTNSYFITAELK